MSLRPSSLRFAVLRLVVQNPGELTAGEIAAHLFPPPRFVAPEPGASLASRAQVMADRRKALDAHRTLTAYRVTRALASLHAAGFVLPCGAPAVSTWFRARMDRYGLAEALERVHPAWPKTVGGLATHRALIEACMEGPPSGADLLGANPSGARKRAWREVSAWGCIVAPGRRVATSAGEAEVRQRRAA